MVSDSLTGRNKATHYIHIWGGGLWGQWASDERGQDPASAPFEIQMQGMGLFACRRDAWPGLNPRMRGHGGEEGYLHEKFRRAGGRVLCHPGVQWLHRSFHSHGLLYPALWRDRARNYCSVAEVFWAIFVRDRISSAVLVHLNGAHRPFQPPMNKSTAPTRSSTDTKVPRRIA